MTIHRNLIEGIEKILIDIFTTTKSTDLILQEHIHANKKWGSRDRRLIHTAVFTIQRNYILLQYLFNTHEIRTTLEAYLNNSTVLDSLDNNLPYPIRYSVPQAFDSLGKLSLGEEKWQTEMKAMHQAGSIFLRIHHPDKNLTSILHELELKEIKFEIVPFEFKTVNQKTIAFQTIQLFSVTPIKELKAYQKGWIDIQDPGSQAIAYFAAPLNGQLIVDGCCGNGGKATGMMLLAPHSKYICMDVVDYKLKQLGQRLSRLQLKPALLQIAESVHFQSLKEKADLVLLDVPCSGSGTIKRQAELKYKINQESLSGNTAKQKTIIENQSIMVKKGGTLIYSTCSLFKEENLDLIRSFISTHESFELIDCLHIYPSEHNTDGFFMASLRRN